MLDRPERPLYSSGRKRMIERRGKVKRDHARRKQRRCDDHDCIAVPERVHDQKRRTGNYRNKPDSMTGAVCGFLGIRLAA